MDLRPFNDLRYVLFYFVVDVLHALALGILGAVLHLLLHYSLLGFGAFEGFLLAANSAALLGTGATLFCGCLLLLGL